MNYYLNNLIQKFKRLEKKFSFILHSRFIDKYLDGFSAVTGSHLNGSCEFESFGLPFGSLKI